MENKEILLGLSERMCGAYEHQEQFLKELQELIEKHPIKSKTRYDFRRLESIPADEIRDTGTESAT